MTFGQILSRGVTAAHRSITALILYFLVFGTFQGLSVVVGGLMSPAMFGAQPGQALPPDFGMLMGFGCFSCFWMLVMLFGSPWIAGGAVGQLRDHIERPGNVPESFAGYAGRFYLPLLALMLIFVVTVFLIYLILGLFVMALLFDQMGGLPMQPQQAQQFQMHPLNIGAGLLGGFALVALSIVFNLANAAVVTDYMDAFTAIGAAFGVVRRRFADAGRLWLIGLILAIPLWGVGWLVQILQVRNLPVLLVLGAVMSVFVPYALLLNMAWAVSLWQSRRPGAEGDADRSATTDGTVASAEEPSSDPLG